MADKDHAGSDSNEVSVDEESRRRAEEEVAGIDARYEPGARPTVTLPGTDGMVSGTAFSEMVDENGELKPDTSADD
ncbi:hypothetical protein [Rhodococcoides yunnanense]|uniref:hypothetical protein n=1 Tax=Rhodococcoides yunnanense TaxID=278209 RepID=UPI0009327F86|nr:hypothetical protein [Rhodococcus yunnanensis]